jgi:hypothetical protein
MRHSGFGRGSIAVIAWLVAAPVATQAQLASSPTFDGEALQGGFHFENPADRDGEDGGVLSLGPLVAGGVRSRAAIPSGGTGDTCAEALFLLIGARGTKRNPTSISLRQSRHVVVFFVLNRCVDGDEVCVLGASEPVAVAKCGGSFKVSTRGDIVGKVKLRCKRGVDTADPAFALSAGERVLLGQAFPDLGRAVRFRFTDRDGEYSTGPDLDFKLRNLNVHALEDIVGTYLADDALPTCVP